MIRIIIIEDHPLLLDGLKTALSKVTNVEVIATFKDGFSAYAYFKNKIPQIDIVLSDVHLPHKNGIETIRSLKSIASFKTILMTVYDSVELLQEAKSIGAEALFLKKMPSGDLLDIIQDVYRGKTFYPSLDNLNQGSSIIVESPLMENKVEILSEREIEVSKYIALGYKNSEIAEQLHLSKRTVDTHRNNILKKLNASNTAAIVRFVVKKGWV